MMRSVVCRSGLAIAMALAVPGGAIACSVVSGARWPTVEERTRAADYVIIGWAERVHDDAPESGEAGFWDTLFAMGRGRVADVGVHEWLKGDGPELITVTGFGYGTGDCLSPVPDGTAIMFLAGDAEDGELALHHIFVYDAVVENSPEATRRVRAAVSD